MIENMFLLTSCAAGFRSVEEVNTKTQKRRSDPIEGCSTVGSSASSANERSPTSVRHPREFDGLSHPGRRGSRASSGNDDVSEASIFNGNDCNDLFDILSRDAASNILNYSSESLTRRKRRPRTAADVGGTDSLAAALTGDRERTASPSPRNARASPLRDIDRYGDGSMRRGSLPLAPPRVDGVVDDVGRPSSGHRRSRRSVDYRHASLHTVDREHCIRLARHVDNQQQHQQPRTEISSDDGGNEISVTSAVIVPDGGVVNTCNSDESPTSKASQTQAVNNWSNGIECPTVIKENGTVHVDLERRVRPVVNGNDFAVMDYNSNVNCVYDALASAPKTVDVVDSVTPPVRRKSCLKNGGSVGQRFDELTGCANDSSRPPNTTPASSPKSSSECRGTVLFRQSSLDGSRSSSSRIEAEAHLIDAAVLEFQTRQVPEREALKNRLRKLTQIYSTSPVPNDESGEMKTWPPRTPSDRCSSGRSSMGSVGSSTRVYENDFDEMTRNVAAFDPRDSFVRPDQLSAVDNHNRHESPRLTATTRVDCVTTGVLHKLDSESLSSQRDEGFESASLSSDLNLSSSQRSSMCDCDTTMVASAFDGRLKDLDEQSYDRVGGVGCIEDNSRGSSQETETVVGRDTALGDMRQADSRNDVENYFALSSIDSLVTTTARQQPAAHVDDDNENAVTDELLYFVPASCDDERNSASPSDASDGRPSSERSSRSMTTSTKTAGSSRLRKPSSSAQSSSSPSKLKPRIPVRTSASSVGKTGLSSTASSVPGSRWSSAQQQQQQPKTVKQSPLVMASSSRRQSVDSDVMTSSPLPRNIKTSQARTKPSTGNVSRTAVRKQTAQEVELHLEQPDDRSRSDEQFVRSSVPRAAISAPVLRANKKAAAEARTQLNRAAVTTKAISSANGEMLPPPQQQSNAKTIAGSSNSGITPGVKDDITASRTTSKLPSRTQVNKGASSRIQPPGGCRIPPPPPSKLQFR